MSDVHSASSTPKIPVSAGVPPLAIGLMVFGLFIIVAILAIVGATASQGHVWPADQSTKVPLSSSKALK